MKLDKDDIVYIIANENNNNKWRGFILGPEETGYSDGIFEVEVTFPSDYPIEAPLMKFITKIFHPNIHQETGEICLEVLKSDWRPYWTVQTIFRAIHFLLSHPN